MSTLVNTALSSATANLEEKEKVLTFFIDEQIYGIEISHVIEIISMQHITKLPKLPSYIKGVINLRGKIIPVINIRGRFGKEEIDYNEYTSIVTVEVNDMSVGIIVDMVSEVLSITENDISKTPEYNSVNSNRYIKYIVRSSDGIKLILDPAKLLFDDKMEAFD